MNQDDGRGHSSSNDRSQLHRGYIIPGRAIRDGFRFDLEPGNRDHDSVFDRVAGAHEFVQEQ